MFERAIFLKSVASAFVATAVPSPAPSASPDTHDGLCITKTTLPYDRPLNLKLRVLDGPDFDLTKYRGDVVWLFVFATWCGPCNMEQARIVATAAKYYDRGLRVVGINFQESDDTVRAYRKKYAIDFPLAMDEKGAISGEMAQDKLGNLSFPTHLLITRDGYLSCYMQGAPDAAGTADYVRDFTKELETLLG